MVSDHRLFNDPTFAQPMEAAISRHVTFLKNCRPLSPSMGSAIRFIKVLVRV